MDNVQLDPNESAQLDALLDEAGFAADSEDPGDDSEYFESDDVIDGDQVALDADEAEEYDDEEPASDAYAPDETAHLKQYAAALEQEIARRQQEDVEQRRFQTLQMLQNLQQNMTNDEWVNLQTQLTARYAMTMQQKLQTIQHTVKQAAYDQAENEAKAYAINALTQKHNLNRTERAAIAAASRPSQMQAILAEIQEARREQTAAARGALRNNRLSRGADESGGRGQAGGRAATKQFETLDELVDSIFQ